MALPKIIRASMTQEDIDESICNSRTKCAIVRTIYRTLKEQAKAVRVSTAGASIDGGDGYRYHYRVPKPACLVVQGVDTGKKETVKPVIFVLRFTNRVRVQKLSKARKEQLSTARALRENTVAAVIGNKPNRRHGRYGL